MISKHAFWSYNNSVQTLTFGPNTPQYTLSAAQLIPLISDKKMKFTASLLASVALIVSGAQASLVCDDPNTDLTCCTFVDASGVGHGCYKYGADGDICGGVARCCSVGSRLLAYVSTIIGGFNGSGGVHANGCRSRTRSVLALSRRISSLRLLRLRLTDVSLTPALSTLMLFKTQLLRSPD